MIDSVNGSTSATTSSTHSLFTSSNKNIYISGRSGTPEWESGIFCNHTTDKKFDSTGSVDTSSSSDNYSVFRYSVQLPAHLLLSQSPGSENHAGIFLANEDLTPSQADICSPSWCGSQGGRTNITEWSTGQLLSAQHKNSC